WEIYNRPAKGTVLPNTFFTLWARQGDAKPIMRVVEGLINAPHTNATGYHPTSGGGLPRFEDVTFHAEYPLARLEFHEPGLPVRVSLEAYTPFVPLNPEDSGIPCAVFNYTLENLTDQPLDVTLVGSMMNPVGGLTRDLFGNSDPNTLAASVNTFREQANFR